MKFYIKPTQTQIDEFNALPNDNEKCVIDYWHEGESAKHLLDKNKYEWFLRISKIALIANDTIIFSFPLANALAGMDITYDSFDFYYFENRRYAFYSNSTRK